MNDDLHLELFDEGELADFADDAIGRLCSRLEDDPDGDYTDEQREALTRAADAWDEFVQLFRGADHPAYGPQEPNEESR